jgi:hypothetical protein
MAYTAQTLVTRAWYLSGIVARNLQTVTGDQITDGLFLLNAILDWKQIQTDLIPYWTYVTNLTTIPNQETYFLPNILEIETVTFNIDVVRYPMDYTTHSIYFGSGRVDNISTLPFNWTWNRSLGGGTLYLYFLPDGFYPLKIFCKMGLQEVTLQEDMLSVYDPSYIEYLRYSLAQYMCSEYGVLFNPESAKILQSIERTLMYVTPPDLSRRSVSILTKGSGINWGDVNIGRGWRPS